MPDYTDTPSRPFPTEHEIDEMTAPLPGLLAAAASRSQASVTNRCSQSPHRAPHPPPTNKGQGGCGWIMTWGLAARGAVRA
eukprot:scaffold2487_cov75-Isochrysis_galbana.AAC.2